MWGDPIMRIRAKGEPTRVMEHMGLDQWWASDDGLDLKFLLSGVPVFVKIGTSCFIGSVKSFI